MRSKKKQGGTNDIINHYYDYNYMYIHEIFEITYRKVGSSRGTPIFKCS